MKYERELVLKDGRRCLLRSAVAEDAEAYLDYFIRCHAETDWLTTYPDENTHTVEEERSFLDRQYGSPNGVEIVAVVDGKIAGSAGAHGIANREKLRHRADFGISVLKEYWRLGIGRALTEACIECAKEMGYVQLELEAVAENQPAVRLYESVGFKEYGRNPKGFRSRYTGWQELVLMRLELSGEKEAT